MEKIKRESFVFYRSFFDSLDILPEDYQLLLYRAIAKYGLDMENPTFPESNESRFAQSIWNGIRPQLDANYQKFLNGCKGSQFGKKGGNPNFQKGKPNPYYAKDNPKDNPKKSPNVNENDNENVNENDKKGTRAKNNKELKLPFDSEKFIATWNELRHEPKWKTKSTTALQKNLNDLGKYPEQFAIVLMENAIKRGWQGVVFPNTEELFSTWKKQQQTTQEHEKIISSIKDMPSYEKNK